MSTRLAMLSVASLLLHAATTLKADVAPFPSWRVVANGAIASAVQAGDAIYLGGAFTKIGRGIAPFDGVLDPATLTLTREAGCARQEGRPVLSNAFSRYLTSTARLEDGAGQFPVAPDTVLVRIGADCRFDRRFRTVLPGYIFISSIADAGPRVFVSLLYAPAFPVTTGNAINAVVELDGVTGAPLRYWPIVLKLEGVTAAGRLVATSPSTAGTAVGWFDPGQGRFEPVLTVPGFISVEHVGAAVVVSAGVANGYEYIALDAATLTPLPSWPQVSAFAGAQWFESGGGRIFMAGAGLKLDNVPVPQILAFDLVTGARLPAWTAPAWMDDARSTFLRLYATAGRLLVLGDFAPGAPRDTVAALDLATGALDPWDFPYSTGLPLLTGNRLHFGDMNSTARVGRDRLAAVAATTGALLPWTAAAPAPPPYAAVSAVDTDAGYLYAGWSGAVRRYGLLSGALDPSWQLDLAASDDAPEAVSAIAVHQDRVYVAGSFYRARVDAAAPWQAREGGLAITAGGALTAWRPRIEARCLAVIRPSGFYYPCIGQMRISEGRVFLAGSLQRLEAPGEARRSIIAVTADTGALDPLLPFVPLGAVSAMASSPVALFAATAIGNERQLARVDTALGARLIVSLGPYSLFSPPLSSLASRDARLYADVERDEASGAPTGNLVSWRRPVAATSGVLDLESASLSFYTAVASVAPAAPTGVTAELNGARVVLRWSPGAGDLRKLVPPPPSGGTAALSHVIAVSLAPGGPVAARVDTGSSDPEYSLVAPEGTFFVRVLARNATGTSLPSAEVRIDVRAAAPEAPVATIGGVNGGAVRLQWQAPPHGWPATSYLLEAGSTSGAADIGVLPVAGLAFSVAGVSPGRYYVRVRAVNAAGASAPGDEVVLDVR